MASKLKMVSWEEFGSLAERLATSIARSRERYELVIGILRGGGPLALVVADRIKSRVDFINVKSYVGVGSRKEPSVLSTITENIGGRNTLIVDDLIDEGTTMKFIVSFLRDNYRPKLLRTSVLFVKPWSKFKPDYYLDTIEEWVVFPWELCEFNILRC